MIITCPSCDTRYSIPPESLGADGRMVRCSSCGHRWFVGHEPEDAKPQAELDFTLPPLEEAPELPPAPPPAQGRARKPGSTGATVGWLAVLLVLLILTGLVLGRNEVVALMPKAAPIYQRIGLPVIQEIGLELRGVVSERIDGEAGQEILKITGDVTNVAGIERTVPPICVALLDATREEVEVHLVEVPQPVLADGASTRFELEIDAPPADARNFSVTFAVDE